MGHYDQPQDEEKSMTLEMRAKKIGELAAGIEFAGNNAKRREAVEKLALHHLQIVDAKRASTITQFG